uniref:Phosphoglucomutase 2 like 1 n=1 Tax=Urocitellus parryii TaxID=9999 RepID=A0A8D2KPM9_UROPR
MAENAEGDLNSNLLHAPYRTGDPQLDTAIAQWLRWDKNPKTKEQIENLLRNGMNKELRDRLCCRMTFGTAGLRSAMGAGFCYINDLTVIQSTQGMYKYLERCFSDFKQRGFVVGYDTRGQVTSSCSSQRLAKLTAAVLLAKDVPVYLFSRYVPTPFVPYAVQELKAVAGVMITASHNRKEDNGYKVYWETGAQITSPHDKEILKCIEECVEPWNGSWNDNLVDTSPLKKDPLQDICKRYMEDLKKICFYRELNSKTTLKFVHTSFHGVGHDYVQLAFQVFGFKPPIPVPEQKDPDPDFSTVKCPNPEEGESVLELSLRLAERENARIVLATDPDADRLAVNVYMLATTVSSKILKAIALEEGFHFEETLPGFKWIGSRIKDLLENEYPKFCGTFAILHIRDVTTGYDSSQPNKKSVLPVSKNSQMITFTFQNGCVATLRTSGTEPKIKYYAEMCASPDQSDTALLEEELKKLIEALIENFLEPSKNGLIWRSV